MLGMLLLAVAGPAFAADGDSQGSWGKFLGRLHVVVLHLPIGLLVGAFAIEFFGLIRRSKGFDIAAAWLFVFGAMSAVVAVVTGLLLGAEAVGGDISAWSLLWADDDQVSETLNRHMWLGVGVMLFAIPAAVLKVLAVRRQWQDTESSIPEKGGWPLIIARAGLVVTMLLLPSVGHLGGNMTHGQDYLTKYAPNETLVSAINMLNLGTTRETVVTVPLGDGSDYAPDGTVASWNAVIQPALIDSCVRCHGPDKQNSGLRLDTLAYATKGKGIAFDYPAITAGDAQLSSLHTVVALPQSHFLFMPPDPKDAFDYKLVSFIGEWIQNFDGQLEDAGSADGQAGAAAVEPTKPAIDIDAITAAGASAQSLSQEEGSDQFIVKFAYLGDLSPQTVAKLETGADKIARLYFDGSAFGDEAAKVLPEMDLLTSLSLKDTAITDAGLAELPELFSLTWLNLFGTEITDAGLASLEKYDLLEKLYLTGTKVTAEGVEKLRQALPDTEVFSDHDGQFELTPVTPEAKPNDPAEGDETTAAAPANLINTKCPVSGAAVKEGFVSTFEGKTVGFCCNNCKGQFDLDPQKFAEKLQ
eukprot:g14371.t1